MQLQRVSRAAGSAQGAPHVQVRNNQTGFDLKITATAIPFDALSNLCEASDATILSQPKFCCCLAIQLPLHPRAEGKPSSERLLFAQALATNESTERLDLEGCGIGDKGCVVWDPTVHRADTPSVTASPVRDSPPSDLRAPIFSATPGDPGPPR
jgi:hypothetical protein